MTLVRWAPTRRLEGWQTDVDRLFDGFFGASASEQQRRWSPAIDLAETEDSFVLRADLPGLAEEDIEIELTDNVLRISGERKSESEEQIEGYYRFERAFGAFSRSLRLPKGVDPETVAASFDRGVLEVVIPKPEERKPRRIEIGSRRKALEAEGTDRSDA